jgi:osmotically-inducible protein OsmY
VLAAVFFKQEILGDPHYAHNYSKLGGLRGASPRCRVRRGRARPGARVKKALEQAPGQIAQGIDVTARRGAVSLFGTVPSGAERGTAGKIAASVSGVSSVDNKLVVVKGS